MLSKIMRLNKIKIGMKHRQTGLRGHSILFHAQGLKVWLNTVQLAKWLKHEEFLMKHTKVDYTGSLAQTICRCCVTSISKISRMDISKEIGSFCSVN